jgi:uncharacterized protein (TIGR02246 family)
MTDKTSKTVSDILVKAMLAGDAKAFAAAYTDDAVLYGPGPVPQSKGRAAIEAEMKGMFDTLRCEKFEWDDQCSVVGDVAYHWGTWKMHATHKASGQKMTVEARTVDVRRRQPDGSWKIVVDQASFFPQPTN